MSTTHAVPAEYVDRPEPSAVRGSARALGALLWRRRWIVALVVILVANGVAAGLVLADREYTASARIAVTPRADLPPSTVDYTDLLGTVADVGRSWPLLEEVADRVPGRSADQLRDDVEGKVVEGTVIVQVAVTDTDAERAARTANLILELLPANDPAGGAFAYHVTEDAVVPDEPSSPNVPVAALAGLVLAFLLAIVAAIVVDRLFRTVSDAEEMGELADTPVLGVIPKPAAPRQASAIDYWAPEFQSIRALRIAVEFASAEDPSRLLVVTSAGTSDPWAGWIEVNLAVALAEVGHRVLVVDTSGDPDVHPALRAPSGEPGLYDVLAGEVDLVDAVREGPTEDVDLLAVGQAHLAPPSLLEMRFDGLLESTEGSYDVVLVHAAPVASSEDARIMAIHGALLLTVPSGSVHPRTVQRAAEHLREIQLRILGSILVGVRAPRRRRVGEA